MHEVLVNRLGGLSLPRKSVVRLTDRPDMTLDVYRGRKTTKQHHETPMPGHLGVNKTYNKILNHFYWPGFKADVSNYCRSCHTCQVVGKPNLGIPKAGLIPIPAFDEPFSSIIIDCVGPLPKTKSGNEYVLTIMCAFTRFPEAIPLRNIKTKTIVKALVFHFCRPS